MFFLSFFDYVLGMYFQCVFNLFSMVGVGGRGRPERLDHLNVAGGEGGLKAG